MVNDHIDEDWREAVLLKAGAAESKFARGEKVSDQDIIAVALVHPESYEIMVKLRA